MRARGRRAVSVMLGLAALGLGRMAAAQSLAARAPADAIAFFFWQGTDSLGQAYDASNLKGLLDATQLPQFVRQRLQDDMAKTPDDALKGQAMEAWLTAVAKAPTAVYVGPFDIGDAEHPQPKIAIYSEIGKQNAARYATEINQLIQDQRKKENDAKAPPAAAVAAGDFLLLTIGNLPDFAARLSGPEPADGLLTVAACKNAMAQVGADKQPATAMYVDAQAALKLLDDLVAAKGGVEAEMWPKFEDAMGLSSLRQMAFTGTFDGADWKQEGFMGVAPRRTGLLDFFDNKPLDEPTLKLVPKTAAWAGVLRFDGPRLLQDIRDAAARIDPNNGPQNMEQGLQQFALVTGVDLEKDLLDTLGDSFVYYGAPDGKGSVLKNATVANRLKDPEKALAALTTLEGFIETMTSQRMPDAVSFSTEMLPAPNDKVEVHLIKLPMATPAWAVSNGILYLSFSMAGIQSAIAYGANGPAILQNPQFVDLWKGLGQPDMSSFSYMDLNQLAREIYPIADAVLKKYQREHPGEKHPYVMPPLDQLLPHLSPMLLTHWSDKDGFHMRSKGPLPGVELLGVQNLIPLLLEKSRMDQAEPAPAAPGAAPAKDLLQGQ